MSTLLTEGFVVLRAAVAQDLLVRAQSAFEAGFVPSPDWPCPRDADWRFSQLDCDPAIQVICRLPDVVAAAGQLIGAPFFLMQVDGREPLPGNRTQDLHRDAEGSERQFAIAMVFLDAFGPENGATQAVPRSHRGASDAEPAIFAGLAGDIVVMDANLLHGATTNHSGARRRSLLATYADATLRGELCHTEALRGVRMDTSEVFAGIGTKPR